MLSARSEHQCEGPAPSAKPLSIDNIYQAKAILAKLDAMEDQLRVYPLVCPNKLVQF